MKNLFVQRVRQMGEVNEAYYYEDHISIQAIYSWHGSSTQSYVSLSDVTAHDAPAVWASIVPLYDKLVR